MKDLDESLKAVAEARRRKKELKRVLEILHEEYRLAKTEIKLHEKRIEELMSDREYSAYLDTIQIEPSLGFPVFVDLKAIDKKGPN